MEHIVVVDDILIAEVEHQGRVQSYAAETRLEMQVRTGATTCVTTQSDNIASTNLLVFLYQLF